MTEPAEMTLVSSEQVQSQMTLSEEEKKQRKKDKVLRYYYRHREELREKRREKLMKDPEYVAKQEAKEAKEAEKERKREERERARVEKSDRRFDIIATSSKYMGDSDFWDKTVKLFELPGAGRMVYDYLMKIDLVGWKHSIFPKTAYHALLSDTEIPPEVRFIKECKPFNDLNGEAFYQMYNDWCTTHRIVIRKSFPVMRKIIAPMVGKVFTVNRKTDGNLYSKADVEEKGRIK